MRRVEIRRIDEADDESVARLIRAVMPEFGACGPGFALADPEVDAMSVAYGGPRAAYFVVIDRERVVGGGGVAPLTGAAPDICELRKMYFHREARGRGVGRRLLVHCLEEARRLGFTRCYLETLTGMDAAQHLYRSVGFVALDRPLGATGHYSCDRWYALDLNAKVPGPSA